VIVRVSAGEKRLWEKRVDAGSDAIDVAIEFSDSRELTIEIDFVDRVAFPCGVDWWDAHVFGTGGE
jgi:hypothetical protein